MAEIVLMICTGVGAVILMMMTGFVVIHLGCTAYTWIMAEMYRCFVLRRNKK